MKASRVHNLKSNVSNQKLARCKIQISMFKVQYYFCKFSEKNRCGLNRYDNRVVCTLGDRVWHFSIGKYKFYSWVLYFHSGQIFKLQRSPVLFFI